MLKSTVYILCLHLFNLIASCSSTSSTSSVNIPFQYGKDSFQDSIQRPTKRWRKTSLNSENKIMEGVASSFKEEETLDVDFQEVFENKIDDEIQNFNNEDTSFIAECDMPTVHGYFKMRSYIYSPKNRKSMEPIVLLVGDLKDKEDVLIRVHDQCSTSEVFGSMRCDCKEQLQVSLQLIQEHGGVVVYLQQEGRGIGIANKIAAYGLQDSGLDTVDANLQLGFKDELREYACIPAILSNLGIKSVRLLTNNPFKVDALTKLGVKISQRIPILIQPNRYNSGYMQSKKRRMNHIIPTNFCELISTPDPDEDQPFSAANIIAHAHHDGSSQSQEPNHPSAPVAERDYSHLRRDYPFGKASVEAAIQAIREGKIIIVVDDEDRENEGDLIMAAEMATKETIGFIVRYSSGVLCASLESDRLEQLKLPPMVVNNEDPKKTAYTVSVDYKHGTTTGISSADRAACFRALADPYSTADDFQRPGHVFPLRYQDGGVLARAGHTEASLDMTRLAGLQPVTVLAEVVNDDGSLKRLPDLIKMAEEFGFVLTSVQDIIAYKLELLSSSPRQ